MSQNFSVPADEMLQDARTMQALFDEDKATFVAFDGDFADPYAADFLTSIDDSEAYETSETREDHQEEETAEVAEAMAEGGRVYIIAKFFIEKAFVKPATRHVFGLDDFDRARGSQKAMGIFLANLHAQCENADYKPALLAAAMTQAQIDAIETAYDLFTTDNTEQNTFIRQTAQATRDRDAQYNSKFEFMQTINRASKAVYYGDAVKINQYTLPHGSAGTNFNVEGKVLDGSNNNAELKGVKVKLSSADLVVETFTNFAGNFGFEGIPADVYNLEFSLPNYTTKTQTNKQLPVNGHITANETLVLA